MPLTKRRPNFSELIAIGARNRDQVIKVRENVRRRRYESRFVFTRMGTRSSHHFDKDKLFVNVESEDDYDKSILSFSSATLLFLAPFIKVSQHAQHFLHSYTFSFSRYVIIALAIISLSMEASNKDSIHWLSTKKVFDGLVNYFFLSEGLIKIIGFLEYICIDIECSHKSDILAIFRHSGLIDVFFGKFSLSDFK